MQLSLPDKKLIENVWGAKKNFLILILLNKKKKKKIFEGLFLK
jgi:hypothetical protein